MSNPAAATRASRQGRARTLVATGVGNALEWFDWTIYAIFATFFAGRFFDDGDPVSAVLSTLAVFAVGFLARPFGGFVFGWVGDRKGRRTAMTLSVGTAAVGSIVIGVSPTYGQIGVGASAILLLARLAQGLAHGGELPSAQTYLSEVAPAARRGLWASFIYFSGTVGISVGTLLGAVLTTVLDEADMAAWGWRVPFVLGGLLGFYALVMRRRLAETGVFRDDVAEHDATTHERQPMWESIVRHRKQALQVIGMTVGLTIVYYAWAISAPQFAITRGVDEAGALWAGLAANMVFIAVLPLWGALSDRIGRKPVLLVCTAGLAAAIFPLTALVGDNAVQLAVTMSLALVLIAGPAAIVPAVFAEMFPTHIRTVGVGVPYSAAVAGFGGTAPYLQTWFAENLGSWAFNLYVVAMLLVSLAVVLTIRETRNRNLYEHPDGAANVATREGPRRGAEAEVRAGRT
jgi:MFS transporter, MHS family, alpha-ketoglutarate permease